MVEELQRSLEISRKAQKLAEARVKLTTALLNSEKLKKALERVEKKIESQRVEIDFINESTLIIKLRNEKDVNRVKKALGPHLAKPPVDDKTLSNIFEYHYGWTGQFGEEGEFKLKVFYGWYDAEAAK